MKLAMPVWENDISTVLDFSETLLIVEIEDQEIKGRSCVNWSLCNDSMRLSLIKEEGVSVLLCGAISKTMQIMLENSGIYLIPCLRGRTEAILKAYLEGNLLDEQFRLPGAYMVGLRGKNRKYRDKRSFPDKKQQPK
ncbi:MAG TPA: NifB/NifX family molybdenum-iron cluster-binding protein [Syntrophales bacterium]|jgi:predicted Fe-Mo cluster-binding NifX family protein|nr:NifB/NifX family molybdenum-iron cluster-binding protein [Syntrophales bacterium]HPX56885.1 NifB/NifX family molybdenum-iron cluster-binding protein [Syntrophales bacterium]